MKTFWVALGAIVVVLCFWLSGTTNQEVLKNNGVIDAHAVGSVEKIPGFQGSIEGHVAGNFLLVSVQIKGGIKSENHIEFSWCPRQGETIVTDVPISLIRVKISSRTTPVVYFVFDENWLASRAKSEYQDLQNANALIESGKLKAVEVYISEADLEKEPALPQLTKEAKEALTKGRAAERKRIIENEEAIKKQEAWANELVTIDIKYFVKLDSTTYTGSTRMTFPRWKAASFGLPDMVETEKEGGLRYFWTSIKLEGKSGHSLLIPTDSAAYPEFPHQARVVCPNSPDRYLDGLLVEKHGNQFTVFAAPTKTGLEEVVKGQQGT